MRIMSPELVRMAPGIAPEILYRQVQVLVQENGWTGHGQEVPAQRAWRQ